MGTCERSSLEIKCTPKRKSPIAVKEKSKDKIYVPTMEKILIDVFSDAVTFYAIQGSEMDTLSAIK